MPPSALAEALRRLLDARSEDVYVSLSLADFTSEQPPGAQANARTPLRSTAAVASARQVRISGIVERVDVPEGVDGSSIAGATVWLTDGDVSVSARFDRDRFALPPARISVGDFVTVVGSAGVADGARHVLAHGLCVSDASAEARDSIAHEATRRKSALAWNAYAALAHAPLPNSRRTARELQEREGATGPPSKRARYETPSVTKRIPPLKPDTVPPRVEQLGTRFGGTHVPATAPATSAAVPADAPPRRECLLSQLSQISQEIVRLDAAAVSVGEAVRASGVDGMGREDAAREFPDMGATAIHDALRQLLASGLAYECEGRFYAV
eukprot:Opistho-1_new@52178